MIESPFLSEFLNYLASWSNNGSEGGRFPALNRLSEQLGLSVAKLREQLELARGLGLVEVRPKTGIRKLPYTFTPAVRQSLLYGIATNPDLFDLFADLRGHIEAAYWFQAVALLTPEDHAELRTLIAQAWEKLRGDPVRLPHPEHRQLHLSIFKRLENPFVTGLLEAFWDSYEAVGLNLYEDYSYLEHVWDYHQRMVEAICCGDFEAGYRALVEHRELLRHRPSPHVERKMESKP